MYLGGQAVTVLRGELPLHDCCQLVPGKAGRSYRNHRTGTPNHRKSFRWQWAGIHTGLGEWITTTEALTWK